MFLKLVFYIQFTTKQKIVNSIPGLLINYKKSGNNLLAFPSDAGYANVVSNVGVHVGKKRPQRLLNN